MRTHQLIDFSAAEFRRRRRRQRKRIAPPLPKKFGALPRQPNFVCAAAA